MSPSMNSTLPNLPLSSFSTISDMVVLPAPDRPENHKVKPRPYLLPFSILIPFCVFWTLLLEHAGLLDRSLLVPQTLDEDLHDLEARELGRRVLALGEHLSYPRAREENV